MDHATVNHKSQWQRQCRREGEEEDLRGRIELTDDGATD